MACVETHVYSGFAIGRHGRAVVITLAVVPCHMLCLVPCNWIYYRVAIVGDADLYGRSYEMNRDARVLLEGWAWGGYSLTPRAMGLSCAVTGTPTVRMFVQFGQQVTDDAEAQCEAPIHEGTVKFRYRGTAPLYLPSFWTFYWPSMELRRYEGPDPSILDTERSLLKNREMPYQRASLDEMLARVGT